MLSKLKELWQRYNPFDIVYNIVKERVPCLITPTHDRMIVKLQDIHEDIKDVKTEIKSEKALLLSELKKKEAILKAVFEVLPDMLWLKDTEGKYILANKALRENLLCCDNPIGRDDVSIAKEAKEKYGNENHTFGEVRGNSGVVVLDAKSKGMRFMESGKVKGKMMHLEVHKGIVIVDGEVIGVVGSGRDMTEYREAFLAHNCGSKCPMMGDVFAKYEFKNEDKGE